MPRRSTPTEPISADALRQAQDEFIAAWGQMGSTWGISRTMAEIHALLYITGDPLCTDDVMDRLAISRGNASMSVRALLDWGIVSKVHKRGDRKEYYQAEQDVWTIARRIIQERLRREIHPVLATLAEIQDKTLLSQATPGSEADVAGTLGAAPDTPADPAAVESHNERLANLIELTGHIDALGERFASAQGKNIRVVASLLSKVV